MSGAHPKIVLSRSLGIPFNKFALPQANVRRIKAGISIEKLAEDIAHRGLLQGLNVRPLLDAEGRDRPFRGAGRRRPVPRPRTRRGEAHGEDRIPGLAAVLDADPARLRCCLGGRDLPPPIPSSNPRRHRPVGDLRRAHGRVADPQRTRRDPRRRPARGALPRCSGQPARRGADPRPP